MMRVNSTCASGASAIGVPAWPDFAIWTASKVRPRTTSIPRLSMSVSVTAATVGLLGGVRASGGLPPSLRRDLRSAVPRRPRIPGPSGAEHDDARRERVDVVAARDRAQLTRAEGARQRERAEHVLDRPGVVVRFGEEVLAPPGAREQERAATLDPGQ